MQVRYLPTYPSSHDLVKQVVQSIETETDPSIFPGTWITTSASLRCAELRSRYRVCQKRKLIRNRAPYMRDSLVSLRQEWYKVGSKQGATSVRKWSK